MLKLPRVFIKIENIFQFNIYPKYNCLICNAFPQQRSPVFPEETFLRLKRLSALILLRFEFQTKDTLQASNSIFLKIVLFY